jgi:hypothetical protein
MNRALTVILLTALFLIGAQVAWSAIPASNGMITGCYTRAGGALRVVGSSSVCDTSTENVLRWNRGPVAFNTVAAAVPSTNSINTLLVRSHGLAISYSCGLIEAGAQPPLAVLTFDPGTTGSVTAAWTHGDEVNATASVVPATQGLINVQDLGENPNFPFRLQSGVATAKTSTNTITVVFSMMDDFLHDTCTIRGTITAA